MTLMVEYSVISATRRCKQIYCQGIFPVANRLYFVEVSGNILETSSKHFIIVLNQIKVTKNYSMNRPTYGDGDSQRERVG